MIPQSVAGKRDFEKIAYVLVTVGSVLKTQRKLAHSRHEAVVAGL